mgnify:CR=1
MRNLLCEIQTWNFSCVPSAFALNCLQMESAFFGTRRAAGLLQQFRRLSFCCGISRSSSPFSQISAPCHTHFLSAISAYAKFGLHHFVDRDLSSLHTGLKYYIISGAIGLYHVREAIRNHPGTYQVYFKNPIGYAGV